MSKVSSPHDAIAFMWTDLDPSKGKVYYGTSTGDDFALVFHDVSAYGVTCPTTVEIVINSRGVIEIVYLNNPIGRLCGENEVSVGVKGSENGGSLAFEQLFGPSVRGMPENVRVTFEPIVRNAPSLAPAAPLYAPSSVPTPGPSAAVTATPSNGPSMVSESPTMSPSAVPTCSPTQAPTASPTFAPTSVLTSAPTTVPTLTTYTSTRPSVPPSGVPGSESPTSHPTFESAVEVVSWETAVNVNDVPARDFDDGAKAAFENIVKDGLDIYDEIVIQSVEDFMNEGPDKIVSFSSLLRRKLSGTSGSRVSFATSFTSTSSLSDDEVQEMLSEYEVKVADFYAESSTTGKWLAECVAEGSTTINMTTVMSFGVPDTDHSSVTAVMVYQTVAPTAAMTTLDDGNSKHTLKLSLLLAILVPLALAILCIIICLVRAARSKREENEFPIIELSTTPNLLFAHDKSQLRSEDEPDPSNIEEGRELSDHDHEDYEDSEYDVRPAEKGPSTLLGAALKGNSLLSKVKSNKDQVMRKQRRNRYAKI